MASTRATQIGKMVSAIVNQKPSEFADTFSSIFKSNISKDTEDVQTDLKSNMFKQGKHVVDFDAVTGRKETTIKPDKSITDVDNTSREDGVMDAFMGGLNKSLEAMYKLDQSRAMAQGDGDRSYSDTDKR